MVKEWSSDGRIASKTEKSAMSSLLSLIHSDFLQYLKVYGRDPTQRLPIRTAVYLVLRSPGLWAAAVQRLGYHITVRFPQNSKHPLPIFLRFVYFLTRQFILLTLKIYIEKSTPIGPGLFLSNKGEIIIGAVAIGANCCISNKVTIGIGGLNRKKPSLGDNIKIGPECIIFGDIRIGNGVTILPHALCSKTIPDNCIVGGYPARILWREEAANRQSICSIKIPRVERQVSYGKKRQFKVH